MLVNIQLTKTKKKVFISSTYPFFSILSLMAFVCNKFLYKSQFTRYILSIPNYVLDSLSSFRSVMGFMLYKCIIGMFHSTTNHRYETIISFSTKTGINQTHIQDMLMVNPRANSCLFWTNLDVSIYNTLQLNEDANMIQSFQ